MQMTLFFKHTIGKQMFEKKSDYMGAKLYNLLPTHIKKISQDENFMQELYQWILQRSFYTLEKFYNWRDDQSPYN